MPDAAMTDHAPMRDAATVRRFVFAGDARFTLSFVSNGDPVRYTYRVRLSEGSDKWAPRFFVSLLTGPDNGSDYTTIGHVATDRRRALYAVRGANPDTLPFRAASRFLRLLDVIQTIPDTLDVHHVGRCGRCGRALTVPESIETGLGPICSQKD
jgi:hypothetical protein